MCGGPPKLTATEEFHRSINTVTAAAWASSNAMNTGRSILGTQTAALAIGGYFALWVSRSNYKGRIL